MNRFSCTTTILTDTACADALKRLAPRRLFLVTDPYFYNNGTAAKLAAASGAESTALFYEVTPDPDLKLTAQGTARVKQFQPDVLAALGGGSAIDCAKAMLYFSGCNAKLVAIPTTSGSGSEVTDYTIVTHQGIKHALTDEKLRPHMAVLDSTLLAQLPKTLVADSGFDVLAHALEAYASRNATPFTDAMASNAFCKAFALLPASYAGDLSARLPIHIAATMAGIAFNQAGLGLCHAMSHSLGGMFHIPHGRLNAILLPAVIGCNTHTVAEKYASLAALAGIGGSARSLAVRSLQNSLIRLRRELELPATLAQAGIAPNALHRAVPQLVEATMQDICCQANPQQVEPFMVRQVLEEVAGRV